MKKLASILISTCVVASMLLGCGANSKEAGAETEAATTAANNRLTFFII